MTVRGGGRPSSAPAAKVQVGSAWAQGVARAILEDRGDAAADRFQKRLDAVWPELAAAYDVVTGRIRTGPARSRPSSR